MQSPPRLVVRVGFTGHRDLPGADLSKLEQRLAAFLGQVRAAADAVVTQHSPMYADEPARIELVTGLAIGADHCAAQAARTAGVDLVALSPFAWPEFEHDFDGDPAGLAAAQQFWKGATSRIELDASVVRKALGSSHRFEEGKDSYVRLGRFLVAQSDILLAVVDGRRPGEAEGGAQWVLSHARRLGVECCTFDVAEADRWSVDALAIADQVARAVGPPTSAPSTNSTGGSHAAHGDRSTTFVDDYLRERDPGREASRLVRCYAGLFDRFVRWVGGAPRKPSPFVRAEPVVSPATEPPPILSEAMARADSLATHFNGLYRTSFAVLSLLGFTAVLAAVLGYSAAGEAVTSPWTFVEVAVLAAILGIYMATTAARLREKGTDYRLLAEMLRVAVALHPMRARLRRRPGRAHGSDGDIAHSWMAWYATALERMAGIGCVAFTHAHVEAVRVHFLDELLAGQREFHRVRSHRYAAIERRIHGFVFVLFLGACAGCIAHFAHYVPMQPWGLVLTAALPALAGALHTIGTQAEFARLERRYRAMEHFFGNACAAVERLPVGDLEHLVQIGQEVGARMIDEVAEWRWLHSVHEPRL